MIQVEVLEQDDCEATIGFFSDGFMLEAFCYPYEGIGNVSEVLLHGFDTSNIGPCKAWAPPIKRSGTYWGYHICAEVVDVKACLVKLKDVSIVLDAPIDSAFSPGTLIQFDVARLDY